MKRLVTLLTFVLVVVTVLFYSLFLDNDNQVNADYCAATRWINQWSCKTEWINLCNTDWWNTPICDGYCSGPGVGTCSQWTQYKCQVNSGAVDCTTSPCQTVNPENDCSEGAEWSSPCTTFGSEYKGCWVIEDPTPTPPGGGGEPTPTPPPPNVPTCDSWFSIKIQGDTGDGCDLSEWPDGDDCITMSTAVTILNNSTGATEMRHENVDPGVWCNTHTFSSGWTAYSPTRTWNLTSGGGIKKVCAEFQNSDGTSIPCGAMIHVPAIPNCTNLTCPSSITLNSTGQFSAYYDDDLGPVTSRGIGIFRESDVQCTAVPAPKWEKVDVTGSGTQNWTWAVPTNTPLGRYRADCRAWNQGTAECRELARTVLRHGDRRNMPAQVPTHLACLTL
jgi:hypothetical protein